MGGHYEKDLFRQLQEVLERCDKLENKLEETRISSLELPPSHGSEGKKREYL